MHALQGQGPYVESVGRVAETPRVLAKDRVGCTCKHAFASRFPPTFFITYLPHTFAPRAYISISTHKFASPRRCATPLHYNVVSRRCTPPFVSHLCLPTPRRFRCSYLHVFVVCISTFSLLLSILLSIIFTIVFTIIFIMRLKGSH